QRALPGVGLVVFADQLQPIRLVAELDSAGRVDVIHRHSGPIFVVFAQMCDFPGQRGCRPDPDHGALIRTTGLAGGQRERRDQCRPDCSDLVLHIGSRSSLRKRPSASAHGKILLSKADRAPKGALASRRPAAYLSDSTHLTSWSDSASFTCGLAGIGICPHTPTPPSRTFLASRGAAA